MKTLTILAFIAVCVSLGGCARATMQIMSRSEGTVHQGLIQRTGEGQGTMTMTIAGVEYSGRYSRTSSEQYTSFVGGYAKTRSGGLASTFGTATTFGSNISLMAILSSPSGEGMRCAMQGDRMSGTGGGICVDNKTNTYDVIYHWSGGVF